MSFGYRHRLPRPALRMSVKKWRPSRIGRAVLIFCGIACLLSAGKNVLARGQPSGDLRLATFRADITPPLGDGVGIGFVKQTTSVEHPLYAKGVVLRDAGGTYVLCVVDLGGLCNDSYSLFRKRIGAAAGAAPSCVAVQAVHQHAAPVLDANARRILYADDPLKRTLGLEFADRSAGKVAEAVRRAMRSLEPVTHVGSAKVKVERVASNRRVPGPDGTILTRYSTTTDKRLQDAPEGLIDPWLRTITFYNEDKPLVQLHYYATHPQTSSGGRVTYDVPGIARERLQRETGVPQIYFTGCGGNVAMGKYSDGSREARTALADRLHAAMFQAAKSRGHREPVTTIRWKTCDVRFPLRQDALFSTDAQQKILKDQKAGFSARLKAAMLLAWIRRVEAGTTVQFSSLAIAGVRILHLPGEPFVQFQLAAQKAFPDDFVAVAGYGECAPWYIGEDRIYTDRGGYEQSWAFTGPCEQLMKQTIVELGE